MDLDPESPAFGLERWADEIPDQPCCALHRRQAEITGGVECIVQLVHSAHQPPAPLALDQAVQRFPGRNELVVAGGGIGLQTSTLEQDVFHIAHLAQKVIRILAQRHGPLALPCVGDSAAVAQSRVRVALTELHGGFGPVVEDGPLG